VFSAISKRWLYEAAAISGHEIGLAELGQAGSSIYFLPCGKIFFTLGAALNVSSNPSGHVPGVGRDGRARRRFFGGARGLDRVSAVVSWVLSVKVRDLDVFLYFLKVLSKKMYPQAFTRHLQNYGELLMVPHLAHFLDCKFINECILHIDPQFSHRRNPKPME
jgi:hypothetical protein